MNLIERIETRLEGENVTVGHNITETPAGRTMDNYMVNSRGVVFQFSIPQDEEDEGVIEDFLEYIEATIAQNGENT